MPGSGNAGRPRLRVRRSGKYSTEYVRYIGVRGSGTGSVGGSSSHGGRGEWALGRGDSGLQGSRGLGADWAVRNTMYEGRCTEYVGYLFNIQWEA